MMPLSHAKEIEAGLISYVANLASNASDAVERSAKSPELKFVFKACTALSAVTSSYGREGVPLLHSAADSLSRIPALVVLGQESSLLLQERRVLESCLWSLYYKDHPVELRWFAGAAPTRSGRLDPVGEASSRRFSWYCDYAKASVDAAVNSEFSDCIDTLRARYSECSASIHTEAESGQDSEHASELHPMEPFSRRDLIRVKGNIERSFRAVVVVLSHFPEFSILNADAVSWARWLSTPRVMALVVKGDSLG